MAVTFDAAGAGNAASTNFGASLGTSWSHTTTSNFVIVAFTQYTNNTAPSTQTFTCTYNSVNMTPMARLDWDPNVSTSIYYMFNPPKGAQTVACGVSSGTTTGRTMAGNSVSYYGVGGVLAGTSASGSSGTSTLSGLSTSGSDAFFIAASGWGGQSGNTYTQLS